MSNKNTLHTRSSRFRALFIRIGTGTTGTTPRPLTCTVTASPCIPRYVPVSSTASGATTTPPRFPSRAALHAARPATPWRFPSPRPARFANATSLASATSRSPPRRFCRHRRRRCRRYPPAPRFRVGTGTRPRVRRGRRCHWKTAAATVTGRPRFETKKNRAPAPSRFRANRFRETPRPPRRISRGYRKTCRKSGRFAARHFGLQRFALAISTRKVTTRKALLTQRMPL
mmetsp:Transcript_9061/g.33837  ORF Transcript_9061/g.33837 Transcript_9061/m.33837 type:complete len:229 (+) Transcript_9061:20-706(+)